MTQKLLNIVVIVSSLFGYLEWGTNKSMFLFQGEWEVLIKLVRDPAAVAHPFVVLPLVGQALLMVTLFQRQPAKWLTITGIAAISILLVFMFIIGILSLNWKILTSTLPFVLTSSWTILYLTRTQKS